MRFRFAVAMLVAALIGGASACGDEDLQAARDRVEQTRKDIEQRLERAREQFEARRKRFGGRIGAVLGELEKAFSRPERTSPAVRSRGRNKPTTIDAFLTELLKDIDRYWTTTFRTAGLPEPQVRYSWVEPGGAILTGCGVPADDRAGLYCSADDTIYVAQQFASDLYRGLAEGLPGESAGYGRAAGDFAVAYVLAHEYAHNLQSELGIFDNSVTASAKPYELHADCLAGTWAHSVYEKGLLEPGDLEEATNAALAVGDFDVGNAQHHGTPQERRDALLLGFNSGEPSQCSQYLPAS
jgi:predicted metalloprotease